LLVIRVAFLLRRVSIASYDEHRESAEAVGGGMLALVLLLRDEKGR
jgi:hypothetical protein